MRALHVVDLRGIEKPADLARNLGVDPELFKKVASAKDRKVFYEELLLPKKNPAYRGDVRQVFSTAEATLADAHKTIARRLELFVRRFEIRYPHPAVHGYVRGRSTRTNAEKHCGHRFILHADIEDFFATVSLARVERILAAVGLETTAASMLARFLTIDEKLPLGLNASPLLANLACLDLDDKLARLAAECNATYTRYADDITFSSDSLLPTNEDVKTTIMAEGFRVSTRKFFLTKRGQSHFVTGLSVSDNQPHVPRVMKRKLRQEIYMATRFGLRQHLRRVGCSSLSTGMNRIEGTLHYLAGIDRVVGAKMMADWKVLLQRERITRSFPPRADRVVRPVHFFCDESEIKTAEGTVLAVALIAIEDVDAVRGATVDLANHYLVDSFSSERKDKLRSKGLHYTDMSQEIRTDYIKVLADLPIRGYLAYDLLENHSTYSDAYLALCKALLPDRLSHYDRADIDITFEVNPRVTFKSIEKLVGSVYDTLAKRSNRRPVRSPSVVQGKKKAEPLLAVADFLLGVFGAYAAGHEDVEMKRFERLRDKYRFIISKPTTEIFSRKRPFGRWPNGSPVKPIREQF
jgi:hypothetical protein